METSELSFCWSALLTASTFDLVLFYTDFFIIKALVFKNYVPIECSACLVVCQNHWSFKCAQIISTLSIRDIHIYIGFSPLIYLFNLNCSFPFLYSLYTHPTHTICCHRLCSISVCLCTVLCGSFPHVYLLMQAQKHWDRCFLYYCLGQPFKRYNLCELVTSDWARWSSINVSELYCDLIANANDVFDVLKDLVATTLLWVIKASPIIFLCLCL